jgi:hypothetical protein
VSLCGLIDAGFRGFSYAMSFLSGHWLGLSVAALHGTQAYALFVNQTMANQVGSSWSFVVGTICNMPAA